MKTGLNLKHNHNHTHTHPPPLNRGGNKTHTMKQRFRFSNEIESALPGTSLEETFAGIVELFEDDDTDPYLLELYRDGVECAIPPRSVSITDWLHFEARCIQAARDTQWVEHLKEIAE